MQAGAERHKTDNAQSPHPAIASSPFETRQNEDKSISPMPKGNNGKRVGSIEKEQYNGEVRKDKVLVIGIEFPDYPNSSITKEETDMYYEDYPISHFQDMVFGENGYKGPNGENLLSMKQFYKKQSGGSYDVDGEVQGWYKAKHEASYYGGNVPDENGSDGRPKELVKEALEQVAQDSNVDLSDYDQWDRDDIDGDGGRKIHGMDDCQITEISFFIFGQHFDFDACLLFHLQKDVFFISCLANRSGRDGFYLLHIEIFHYLFISDQSIFQYVDSFFGQVSIRLQICSQSGNRLDVVDFLQSFPFAIAIDDQTDGIGTDIDDG